MIHAKLGTSVQFFFVGLAAAAKNLSSDSHICFDEDVWLMSAATGRLYASGAYREGANAWQRFPAGAERAAAAAAGISTGGELGSTVLAPASEIDLEYDAKACTLRFKSDGQLLGEHVGVVGPVKLVVSMGQTGNGIELL